MNFKFRKLVYEFEVSKCLWILSFEMRLDAGGSQDEMILEDAERIEFVGPKPNRPE